MSPQSASPTTLRRIALLCALLVLLIAGVSAFLRLSKAGLGCEPWPTCYGEALRALQRGAAVDDSAVQSVALARLAHRVLASTALVLVLLLAFGHLSARPLRRDEARLSVLLVATALFLAGLGWLTASSRSPAVALGNLLGGFVMLALSWRLAAPPRDRDAADRGARPWVLLALACTAIQVALGGLVSASYASLSCADTLDCLRLAASQGWPWSTLKPWREPMFDVVTTTPPINPAGALAQAVHRAGALVTGVAVLLAAWQLGRQRRRRAAAALLGLLMLQAAVGWWLVTGGVPLAAALLHNLLAALMCAALARQA